MKLHNVSNPQSPRALEPAAATPSKASSAGSWSAASAIKYAATYGLLALSGAAARVLPQATGADGALALPKNSGTEGARRLLAQPPRFDPALNGLWNDTAPLQPAPAPTPELAIPESRVALQSANFLIASQNGWALSASRANGQPLGLTQDLSPGGDHNFDVSGGTIKTGESPARCLDVKGGAASIKSGATVDAWTCNGQANQQWQVPTLGVSGTISPKNHKTLCLDVPGGRYGSDAKLQIYTCNGGKNQQFTVTSG